MGWKVTGVVWISAVVGCGSDGGTRVEPDRIDAFLADWFAASGARTLECTDGYTGSESLSFHMLRFETGIVSELLYTDFSASPPCNLDFDVEGSEARALAGQTCVESIGPTKTTRYDRFVAAVTEEAGRDVLRTEVASWVTTTDGALELASCSVSISGSYVHAGEPTADAAPTDAAAD